VWGFLRERSLGEAAGKTAGDGPAGRGDVEKEPELERCTAGQKCLRKGGVSPGRFSLHERKTLCGMSHQKRGWGLN